MMDPEKNKSQEEVNSRPNEETNEKTYDKNAAPDHSASKAGNRKKSRTSRQIYEQMFDHTDDEIWSEEGAGDSQGNGTQEDDPSKDGSSKGDSPKDGSSEKDSNGDASDAKPKPIFDVRNDLPGSSKSSQEDASQPGMMRILLILALIGVLAWWFMGNANKTAPINYGFFLQQLDENNLEKVTIDANKVSGEFRVPPPIPESAASSSAPSLFPLKFGSGNDAKANPDASSDEVSSSKDLKDSRDARAPNAQSETDAASKPVASADAKPETATDSVTEKPVASADAKPESAADSATEKVAAETASETGSSSVKVDSAAASEGSTGTASEKTNPAGAKAPDSSTGSASNAAPAKKRGSLPKRFTTTLPSQLEAGGELDCKIRERVGENYNVKESLDAVGYMMLISIIVTIVLVGSIWMQFRRTRDQLGGGQMFGFSKSPAKRFQGGEDAITFTDVAGLKAVKEDLSEIVDFLKNPKKFERLGARIPKGVLMCGPPGTGKTLLARAIAGEAGVAFYSINASEFIQMFVGVGASRVRDMFDVARSNAPAILFIDEIDAIGRLRGTGIGGGNDEREQTLNQILSEMDGFATTDVVIVIAATNRPDVLDPALLRPGRFDRHVTVDRPVHKDRIQLFRVHTKKVPLNTDINFERLAAMTTGLTGADIRNIVNEAALWACRFNRENVSMGDFYYAIDKVLMGAKREEVISDEEKEKTSYHEAGHTLVAWLTPECDRVSKVSVIPRGRALGVTWSVPEEDRLMHSQREIHAKLKMMLGGREAEKLVFNELNAGAANDLERATEIVQKMVASWGMSPRIGPAAFRTGDEHPFLGKEMSTQRNFSDKTAQIIDEEIMRILNDASQQVEVLLSEHRNLLDALAQALVIREELDESQIEEILGPPAYRRKLE